MDPTLVLGVIEESLELLNKIVPDQATKIARSILELRGKWDEEVSKGDNRDDAMLDCIRLQLSDIRELFSSAIKSAALKSVSQPTNN